MALHQRLKRDRRVGLSKCLRSNWQRQALRKFLLRLSQMADHLLRVRHQSQVDSLLAGLLQRFVMPFVLRTGRHH